MPTPAILERVETKNAIEADRSVSAVLDEANTADTYLFSAGPASEVSIHVHSGYVDGAQIAKLQKLGAVGDVLGRYITSDGDIADPELDQRTLGLSLARLRQAAAQHRGGCWKRQAPGRQSDCDQSFGHRLDYR